MEPDEMSGKKLNLKPVDQDSTSQRIHKRPRPDPARVDPVNSIRPTWEYAKSRDGEDRNLIIMLHGIGDTEKPFFQLAQKWQLPGTSILSLRGFFQVPLMDFPSYSYLPINMQHYLSPDPPPTPTQEQLKAMQQITLPLLKNMLRYLVRDEKEKGCGWAPEEIHLFGWGEGGTIALELARSLKASTSASTLASISTQGDDSRIMRLGSVVSVAGELYSTPPVGAEDLGAETPVLYFHRPKTSNSTSTSTSTSSSAPPPLWLKRTFSTPKAHCGKYDPKAASQDEKGRDIRMPQGRDEWEVIMRFWSEVLIRPGMNMGGEVYEVVR